MVSTIVLLGSITNQMVAFINYAIFVSNTNQNFMDKVQNDIEIFLKSEMINY